MHSPNAPITGPQLFRTPIAAAEARPTQAVLFLHGILGTGKNWATVARRLVADRPDWLAVLVDLRLHGRSQGFGPPHTLRASAEDLLSLAAELPVPTRAIVGHSFGGKVGLEYATLGETGLEKLFVMDSTPEAGRSANDVMSVLAAMKRVQTPQSSRGAVTAALEAEGLTRDTARWLAGSAEASGTGYRWNLDFDGLESLMQDFYQQNYWTLIENPPPELTIHLVKAARSHVLSEAGEARARECEVGGQVHVHVVEDAGHWLHVDNPNAVHQLLRSAL